MKLNFGDRVAIVAPASQFRGADRPLLDQAVEVIAGWGLTVECRLDPGHHFYLAGDDITRATHLMGAVNDPEIKAIFCTRGGYGSARLLRRLDANAAPAPKILVGYSDVSSLHLGFNRLWPQIDLVHGPNVATHQFLKDDEAGAENRASLHQALFNPERDRHHTVDVLVPGHGAGPIMGGCLSIVCGALGTPFSIESDGALLFLEDTGESPYRIDRMVTHLRNAGAFEGVKGVVFGVMRDCVDPYNDLRAVLSELLGDLSIPVAFGLRSGHGDWNASLRLRDLATLDSANGLFSLSERI